MAETKKTVAPQTAKKAAPKGEVTFAYNNDTFTAKVNGTTARDVAETIVGMKLALPKSKVKVTIKIGKDTVTKTYFRVQALKLWSSVSSVEINVGLLMRGM